MRRILLWACFFTFIFLSTTWLFNGCKSETSEALEVVDDISDEAGEAARDKEDNIKDIKEKTDRFFEDDDEIVYSNEDEEDDSELANDLFREEPTQTTRREPVKKKVTQAPPRSSATGRYLVVAGNYLVEANAREMVKKLKNMGFNGAEHLVFDQSQYYTVVASRSNSNSSAQSSSDNLKGKGIDNYVHTQRD